VVKEALDLFQALVPPNIELRREIDPAAGLVSGDATLLNQVVLNLCTNAVQAMRERGGSLIVSVRNRMMGEPLLAAHLRALELRVRDTGHGMDPQTRERIFEPYFTTRDVGEGSGLGLSIVHGILVGMGGAISVSSALHQGTEFTVVFPEMAQTTATSEATTTAT